MSATIISFTTRQSIDAQPRATFEILMWDDPVLRETVRNDSLVVIDGLVPPDLATEFAAMCAAYNERIAS